VPCPALSCPSHENGTQPPTSDACESVDCLSTCIIDFYMEYVAFYREMFTLSRGCYGTYMCIPDQIAIMDSDGTCPNT
jgi:hypothetical protein